MILTSEDISLYPGMEHSVVVKFPAAPMDSSANSTSHPAALEDSSLSPGVEPVMTATCPIYDSEGTVAVHPKVRLAQTALALNV